jgi:hypothetical protein
MLLRIEHAIQALEDEPPEELYADPAVLGPWYATASQSYNENHLARALYDEVTNMAMGHGLGLGGTAHDDDGRYVVEVSGAIDLVEQVAIWPDTRGAVGPCA